MPDYGWWVVDLLALVLTFHICYVYIHTYTFTIPRLRLRLTPVQYVGGYSLTQFDLHVYVVVDLPVAWRLDLRLPVAICWLPRLFFHRLPVARTVLFTFGLHGCWLFGPALLRCGLHCGTVTSGPTPYPGPIRFTLRLGAPLDTVGFG